MSVCSQHTLCRTPAITYTYTYTTQKQTATIIKKYCLNWLGDEIGEERTGERRKNVVVAAGLLDINSTYTKFKVDRGWMHH